MLDGVSHSPATAAGTRSQRRPTSSVAGAIGSGLGDVQHPASVHDQPPLTSSAAWAAADFSARVPVSAVCTWPTYRCQPHFCCGCSTLTCPHFGQVRFDELYSAVDA